MELRYYSMAPDRGRGKRIEAIGSPPSSGPIAVTPTNIGGAVKHPGAVFQAVKP